MKHRDLTEKELEFLKEHGSKAPKSAFSTLFGTTYQSIKRAVDRLRRAEAWEGKKSGRQGNALGPSELKDLWEGRNVGMLSKFFVNRSGETYTQSEIEFLQATSGIKCPFEQAPLLGRSEQSLRAVASKNNFSLGYGVDSGFWTFKDVAKVLKLSPNNGGMLRRRIRMGHLVPLEGTGRAETHLDFPVSKIRYVIRDRVKNGKDVTVKSAREHFKLSRFHQLMFTEEEVERFVRDIYPSRKLECILCSDKAVGSIYCSRCQGSSALPMDSEVTIERDFDLPSVRFGCCHP